LGEALAEENNLGIGGAYLTFDVTKRSATAPQIRLAKKTAAALQLHSSGAVAALGCLHHVYTKHDLGDLVLAIQAEVGLEVRPRCQAPSAPSVDDFMTKESVASENLRYDATMAEARRVEINALVEGQGGRIQRQPVPASFKAAALGVAAVATDAQNMTSYR
jgi:hypothetical protein